MFRTLLLLMVIPVASAYSQQTGPSQSARPKSDVKVKAAKPEYRAEAKISPQVATDSALARVPGGRVQEAELEKEHGRLVYSFDIQVPQQPGEQEVQVDARSGNVVSVEHESAKAEAKEQAHEHEHEHTKAKPRSY
jgi:hypothetical protein